MADETPGIEPGEVVGHAKPNPGEGEAAQSEIPEGVDSLSDEQIQAAEERGGGGDDEDDSGALDMADIMAEAGGDAEAEGGDAEAEGGDAGGEDDAT